MEGRGGINAAVTTYMSRVANIILGTDPNAPLSYAMVLELHHPIMSMVGGNRVRLERDIGREIEIEVVGVPLYGLKISHNLSTHYILSLIFSKSSVSL